eukprot:scaffold74141_cov27-Phaeocystis_antarctica.AAC.1
MQDPSSRRLGAQQQIKRPEPMQASSPMSPESRPKRGSRKLTSEKQDLPGKGSRAEHVWARARLDAARRWRPGVG